MSSPNVRIQNLRDFTVQIRRLSDDAIVGTGIVVSMDGKVVTCAHVVEKAGVAIFLSVAAFFLCALLGSERVSKEVFMGTIVAMLVSSILSFFSSSWRRTA